MTGEIGREPGKHLEDAARRVSSFPRERARPHDDNLPSDISSFVGREREVSEVRRLLSGSRLLTLTGSGGCGKTRLALEAAGALVEEFEDGAWLVELAPLSDPDLVTQAVASNLGVREVPGRPLAETLAENLRRKEMLLILDNCEHLIDSCAPLAAFLLRRCPRLRVLATSREALGVLGEALFAVPSLSLPDPRHLPTVGDIPYSEATTLFVERARAVKQDFALHEDNASAVAQVCCRLDGIPLAIELAASKVRVLSVEQIAARLDQSIEFLKSESRTVDARQRTLRATVGWSHDLLSEQEQVLFRRLSAFVGGWTLEAAEEVCAAGSIERGEVLDLLTNLVDKSLVLVAARRGAETRYRLLETIRQAATGKLAGSGEEPETRRRHAQFFARLAGDLELAMWGAEEAAWLGRIEAERDNMRAALSWSLERDAELGLRLAAVLRWYWYWRGHYGEGRRWLDEMLMKGVRSSVAARAKALHAAGWMAHDQGDLDRARAAAEEGIELGRKSSVENSLAASFRNLLGEAEKYRGDFQRAAALFKEGTALYRGAGDERGVAWGLFLSGNASSLRGDHQQAKALYEEGLTLSRRLGGAQPLGDYLSHLGYEFLLEDDHGRAATLNEEAAELLGKRGYRGGLQFALKNLGWAALVRGDYERAAILHRQSLQLCRELGDRLVASESIEGLACAAGTLGELERAAKMFGSAQSLREGFGYQPAPRWVALQRPYMEDARSKTDTSTWDTGIAEGRSMTFTEAVEYGLQVAEPGPVPATPATRESYPAGLSTREAEVLGLVAKGLTNAQVAKELFISPNTVNRHLNSIYQKLGVSSRAAATRFALEHDLA